jgi:23S rRNA (cytidine1920-2'-O)/16S rRNA (cytidine1409-2'-O)-methyltransferase
VGKGGVVRSSEEHARVIEEIQDAATNIGYKCLDVTESPLLGPAGNREFLMHLALSSAQETREILGL